MNIAFLHRAGITCLVFLAVVAVFLFVPGWHTAAHSSGVIEACINPGNGMVRLVDANTACHNNETRIDWNITGPQGPPGPKGDKGDPGSSSGGPPFVWVCTPANYDIGNNAFAEIDIFNGSANTANISAHFLAKDGTNLAGGTIPGTNPADVYPGQTGNNTVTLAAQNTMIIPYQIGSGFRKNDNTLLATVVVTSDQQTVVGNQIPNGPPQATPCTLLPK